MPIFSFKSQGILTLEESDESPYESEALQHYLVADRQKILSAAAGDLRTAAPAVKLRFFKGNLLSETPQSFYMDLKYSVKEKGFLGIEVYGSDKAQIVQLLQTGAPPLNMVLPALQRHNCRMFITSLMQGKYTLDAHLEDENTENLRRWFEWLPDASAIRGEHLALSGRHEEALSAFLEIESRGLPIFSDGLSYTVEHLSTYLDLKPDFIDEETFKRTKSLLAGLQKIAAYTDFREPFTTFTGLDITEPSAELISKIPKDDNIIDLTQQMS